MENASKALIIAGSILVSILLISIGVFIINSIGDTQANMEDAMGTQAIETFNSTYTAYIGQQSGSNVKTLLNKVSTNNSKGNVAHPIDIKGTVGEAAGDGATGSAISEITANIITTKTYKVIISAYDENGYVSEITINEAGSTTSK